MKQFNSKEYLKHPSRKVVTRDGRPVRILCTDANGKYPVIALAPSFGEDVPENYTEKGRSYLNGEDSNSDLFFDTEKKEGWANLYRCEEGNLFLGKRVYASKEKAEEFSDNSGYIDTIHIEWEE